jgi:5-methylcytosine-specific restriction protein A
MEKLKLSSRSREYILYSPFLRGLVAFRFLTQKSLGHRFIDDSILGMDSKYTRGYQSMGILHFQGLYKEHSGALFGFSIDEVISTITNLDGSDVLLQDLNSYGSSRENLDANLFQEEFSKKIEVAFADDPADRIDRLNNKTKTSPQKVVVLSTVFERDPDVVAETLFRSNGICGRCMKPAPFKRKKDGRPYLEVHHLIPLSKGGSDELNNVIALCPNCHRESHFG